MTEEEARIIRAKKAAKDAKQREANRAKEREKALLAEADAVIAAAEKAASANGLDNDAV